MRPHLVRWHEQYADQGLRLIEITRGEEEPLNVVKEIVEKQHLNHPVLWDRNCRNHKNYGLKHWPVAYLVDVQGRVFWEGNLARVVNRRKATVELKNLIEEKLKAVKLTGKAAAPLENSRKAADARRTTHRKDAQREPSLFLPVIVVVIISVCGLYFARYL